MSKDNGLLGRTKIVELGEKSGNKYGDGFVDGFGKVLIFNGHCAGQKRADFCLARCSNYVRGSPFFNFLSSDEIYVDDRFDGLPNTKYVMLGRWDESLMGEITDRTTLDDINIIFDPGKTGWANYAFRDDSCKSLKEIIRRSINSRPNTFGSEILTIRDMLERKSPVNGNFGRLIVYSQDELEEIMCDEIKKLGLVPIILDPLY